MSAPACQTCGARIPCAAETWPDRDGRPICQMCWEADCDAAWWRAVRALGAAGLLPVPDAEATAEGRT